MQKTNIKPSTLLILLSLIWIPETLVILQLIYVNEIAHTSVMKPLVACFELAFIAAVLLESRPLIIPHAVTRLSIPILMWLFWMLLAALFSNHTTVALLRTAEWTTHVLFAVTLISYLYREDNNIKEISDALLIGFFFYTLLYSIYVSIYGHKALAFDHIRHYGHYAVIALFMSLSVKKSDLPSYATIFKISVLIIAWTALFWAGGRGPIFALFVVTTVLFVSGHFASRGYLLSTLSISAVAGLLISIPISDPDYGIYRIFHTISESQNIDAFSSSRITIWRTTLSDILSNPLFGLGPEGFVYSAGEVFHPILHPHNSIFQFMIEWGVPGTILFLWLLYRIFYPAFIATRSDNNVHLFSAFWAGTTILFYSLFTGNLYVPFSTFMFVVVTSVIITSNDASSKKTSVNKKFVLPFFILATMATVFHAYIIAQFIATRAQTPNQLQEKIFKTVPVFVTHPNSHARVIEWSRQLYRGGEPEKAFEWLDWGKSYLPRKWMFGYAEADLFLASGLVNKAQQCLSDMEKVPIPYQPQIDCLRERINNAQPGVLH